MKTRTSLVAIIVAATFSGSAVALAPRTHAAPAPEVDATMSRYPVTLGS